jgi:hypothetical protein
MNIERMNMMRDLMVEVSADKAKLAKFNLGNWIRIPSHSVDSYMANLNEKEPSCGFSACACGWAGITPAFNALGFYALANEIIYAPNVPVAVVLSGVEFTDKWIYPSYNSSVLSGYEAYIGFEATREFFGIGHSMSDYLFEPSTYLAENEPDMDFPYDFEPYDGKLDVPEEEDDITPEHVICRIDLLLEEG